MSFSFDAGSYRYPSRRRVVFAGNGMVCASQPLAAQAGVDALRRGGNAVDAVLAAALHDIWDTPVTPELLPIGEQGELLQKSEDSVGPYILQDFFLYHMVMRGGSPEKVLRLAEHAFGRSYDRATILKWLRTFYRRFFAQQFKRSCLPDGPKVGSVTLSPRGDWRMPSDAVASLWLEELEGLE